MTIKMSPNAMFQYPTAEEIRISHLGKYGETKKPSRHKYNTIEEKFFALLECREPEECWYIRSTHSNDIPSTTFNRKHVNLRRLSLEIALHRKLEPNESIVLTCNDRFCVNPGHMEIESSLQSSVMPKKQGYKLKNGGSKLNIKEITKNWTDKKFIRDFSRASNNAKINEEAYLIIKKVAKTYSCPYYIAADKLLSESLNSLTTDDFAVDYYQQALERDKKAGRFNRRDYARFRHGIGLTGEMYERLKSLSTKNGVPIYMLVTRLIIESVDLPADTKNV